MGWTMFSIFNDRYIGLLVVIVAGALYSIQGKTMTDHCLIRTIRFKGSAYVDVVQIH